LTPLAGVSGENDNFNIGLSRMDKEFYEATFQAFSKLTF